MSSKTIAMNDYNVNPFLTKSSDLGNEVGGDFSSLFIDGSYELLIKASVAQNIAAGGVFDASTTFDDSLLSSPLGDLSPYLTDSTPYNSAETTFLDTPELDFTGSPNSSSAGDDFPSLFYPTSTAGALPSLPSWSPSDVPASLPAMNVSPQMMTLDFAPPSPVESLAREIAPLPQKSTRGRKPSAAKAAALEAFEKDKFTGTRNTKKPAIDFTAPTLPKTYIIPASTSRKRAPAAITAKLAPATAKRARNASVPPASVIPPGDEGLDPSELPEELLEAIEQKRRSNTLAARRSRMRKTAHIDDLKSQIVNLTEEVDEWKKRAAELEEVVRALRGC